MAEQNVMSKIMKLLERANHPGTPLVEAQSCADKAEQLMAQHQIDRMDLKPEDRSKVVKDEWILNVGGMEGNFRYHLVVLLETITKHCKIRMNHTSKSVKDENGNVDYSRRAYVLVGFPEDLSYAEQIWFRVFKEFVTSINPQWDGSKSLGENCYAMLSAGFKWGEIWGMAYRLQPTDGYAMRSGRNIMIADPATTKYNSSLKKAVKEYMEDAGIGEYTSHTQRHNVYRNNFAQSFSDTIGSRLRDQRKKAEEVVSDSDKYALALRTTEEQVDEEFYRLFPEYDPDVQRKKREAQEFEMACKFAALPKDEQERLIAEERERNRKANEAWERRSKRARAGFGRVRSYSSFDNTAWARGQAAGNRVNLSVDGEVKKTTRKEIS